jgi:hypothetical protein
VTSIIKGDEIDLSLKPFECLTLMKFKQMLESAAAAVKLRIAPIFFTLVQLRRRMKLHCHFTFFAHCAPQAKYHLQKF